MSKCPCVNFKHV